MKKTIPPLPHKPRFSHPFRRLLWGLLFPFLLTMPFLFSEAVSAHAVSEQAGSAHRPSASGLAARTPAAPQLSGRRLPFEIIRHKVILDVKINDSRPLKIILDSGMSIAGIILFKSELGDELNLEGTEIYRIGGAGQGKQSFAVRAPSQTLSIGDARFEDQPVLILQNDTMSESPNDGVMGNTLFGSHAVRFDFENKIITLMEPGTFVPDPPWEALDMTLNNNGIPFITVSVSVRGEEEIPLHVYIDSASSEALELLARPERKFPLPDDLESYHLGRGLDGDIDGMKGRVAKLRLGSFLLENIPTAFPDVQARSRQDGAEGIICNHALLRFHVVFDFSGGKLYLKPNRSFGEPFD